MTSQPQPAHNADEDRLYRRVKIGILIMLAIFVVQIFTFLPQYWPITRWRMYSAARELAPTTTSVQIRVTDSEGATYDLFPPDMGFAADSTAGNIMEKAFASTIDREAYQALLVARTQAILPGIDIATISGWRNTYQVAYTTFPPFDLNQPDEATLLGTIELAAAS